MGPLNNYTFSDIVIFACQRRKRWIIKI